MKEMEKQKQPEMINKVEEMKRDTALCKRLFPQQAQPPEMGELIFMVRRGLMTSCTEEEIRIAGSWWLWVRTLFIENTMTKREREVMRMTALNAVKNNHPIHFVSTRSPELIHAQISTQGDSHLPRSRIAIREFADIIQTSSKLLPTIGTILLADVAIDNLEAILKVCPNLEGITRKNFARLNEIINEEGITNVIIVRLSELPHPSGMNIGDLVSSDGSVNVDIEFSSWAIRKISVVSKESLKSHQRMFGWSQEQSEEHNLNLAETMALVGQAIKEMQPPAILIHNEAFISRGALNNLLNPQNNPLPVICLATLLEKKKV